MSTFRGVVAEFPDIRSELLNIVNGLLKPKKVFMANVTDSRFLPTKFWDSSAFGMLPQPRPQ